MAAVLVGLALAIGVLGATGAMGTAPAEDPVDQVVPVPTGVLYEVTGDAARALVTYGANGAVTEENGVGLPWARTAAMGTDAGSYTLTAQSSSDDAGQITCRISLDGTVIAEQTSSARYSVATCVGTASGR